MNIELRFTEGTSYKYYKVRIIELGTMDNPDFETRGEYARIGCTPNTNVLYRGPDLVGAQDAGLNQLRKKIKKGYQIHRDLTGIMATNI